MVTQLWVKATLSLAGELSAYAAPVLTLFVCAVLSLLNCKKKKAEAPPVFPLPAGEFPQTPTTTPSNVSVSSKVQEKELANGPPDDGKKGEKKQDADKKEEGKKREPEPAPKPTATSKENAKEPAKKDDPPKSNPILSNPLVTPVTDENPSAQKNANGEKEPEKSTANKDGGSVKTLQGTQSEADPTQES